ncbi:hypothetical protein DBA26_08925 [Brucella canis]|nr:hypothetical protein C6Y57_03610 [Brucella canis]RXX11782.1 hypothetical protein DBA27_15560 [Brucella canis]RXX16026.1 hypothetical protein DBA26_08925 [Brucella canis]
MKLQLSPLHQNARRASSSRQHKLCAAAYHAYAAQIYNPGARTHPKMESTQCAHWLWSHALSLWPLVPARRSRPQSADATAFR